MKKAMLLVYICFLLFAARCGAPIFRSDEVLFAPAPAVIAQLEPYLEEWATKPASQTEAQRREIADQMDEVIWIELYEMPTANGENFYVVDILLEVWGDWFRGYLYVYDGSEPRIYHGIRLRPVNDHLWIYNYND